MASLHQASHVHLIGIGGISMSALAFILLERGYQVSGSDQTESPTTEKLKIAGATLFIGHHADHITTQDTLIYTGAISENNPELTKALALKLNILTRTEAINALMAPYKKSIAISGTHGKTTTSSMTAWILEKAGQEPSYLIGAKLPQTGKAYHMTASEYIVVEACEYKESFLDLYPTSIVVNNIEEEHLDYYDDLDHIVRTFQSFADHLSPSQYLIINQDDFSARKLNKDPKSQIVSYAINEPATFEARQLKFDAAGCGEFELYYENAFLATITLSVSGRHNVYNALAACAATYVNGISIESIVLALKDFHNAERRFEVLGTYQGATLVSDYAHHPSAVKTTLHAARNINRNNLVVVFQPHTYTRTKSMLVEFSTAFKEADHVWITDIYAAREKNEYGIHSKDLVDLINEEGQDVHYLSSLEDIPDALSSVIDSNTLIIMMGAGDIDAFARKMI